MRGERKSMISRVLSTCYDRLSDRNRVKMIEIEMKWKNKYGVWMEVLGGLYQVINGFKM